MDTAEKISYQAEEAEPKKTPASPERTMAAMSIMLTTETSIHMDQPGCAATNSMTCYFKKHGQESCMSWCGRV